jgi:hypothetical protein
MEPITNYYEMIETIIRKFGVDPQICRGEQAGQWTLKKGSATIWVDVWKLQDDDYGYLQVMAPISELPVSGRDIFLTEVLELNHNLYGVGFTKYQEWIYIKGIRELDGLSEEEATAMMNRVGNYADEYDDYFKNKYFPTTGGRPPQE